MRRSLAVVLAAALLGCSRPSSLTLSAFEGEITMRTKLATGAPPQDMVVKTKGDKLRFDMTGAGAQPTHVVLDPKGGKLLLVIDAQKTYFDMDFSAPSAQPSTNPTTSAATATGTHRQVAGYDCEEWKVTDASGKRSDVCMAQGIAFFDPTSLRPGAQHAESPLARKFRENKSFPLESVDYDAQGKELSRMDVVKIDKKSLDDSEFAVPADYKRMQMPQAPTAR